MGTDNDLIHGETWPSLLSLFVSTSLLHNCLLNVQRQAVLKQSFCGRLEVKQCFAYYAVRSQSWDLSNLNNWTNLHYGICCLWALEDVFFYRTHFPAQALAFIVLLCHVFIAFVKAVGLFAYIITQCTHTACALHGCLQSTSIWLLAIDLYAGLQLPLVCLHLFSEASFTL